MAHPPAPAVTLSADDRQKLESWVRCSSTPNGLANRGRIVLLAAEGMGNKPIAERLGVCVHTVRKWRQRFNEAGADGLYDEPRPGRPRTTTDEQIAELLATTLQTKPKAGTHWTVRLLETETGISKSTVQRVLSLFNVRPHRHKDFKLSNDPLFVDKVRDIVGLYLNPPQKALVLCVDEKTQCQALERTQPALPLGLGYVETFTHDYNRHGTTNLFAALNIATGEVIAQCKPKHRHEEFLQFLRHIEQQVPNDLDIHLVLDNYATHKHDKVKLWLAKRPRFAVHYTPTYSSWLNQVEIWFNLITRRAIRRGSFTSTKQLISKIEEYVASHNQASKPFAWVATADSILEKIGRLCERISGTQH